MTLRRLFWTALALLALLLFWRWEQRSVEQPPGVLVPEAPVQQAVGNSVFGIDDFVITRRARFEIRARVLASERYRLGPESALSPLDLAMGWGPMSDSSVLERIDVSQAGRWFHLRWPLPAPIPEQAIMGHSGNMHMIPAGPDQEKALKALRPGEVATLTGFLVDVDGSDGWRWRTSLSRHDRGDGSCEIVYVESVATE